MGLRRKLEVYTSLCNLDVVIFHDQVQLVVQKTVSQKAMVQILVQVAPDQEECLQMVACHNALDSQVVDQLESGYRPWELLFSHL